MKQFTIQPAINWYTNPKTGCRQRGLFLKKLTKAYCNSDYESGGGMWKIQGRVENMIWTFKNDVSPFPERLQQARQQFAQILLEDLPKILDLSGKKTLTICAVPRAKEEGYYYDDQLYFKAEINRFADTHDGFTNGVNYTIRHTNTKTTHLDRNGEGGDGFSPYPGITKDTCTISDEVVGKDILLIDDVYTEGVCIDEDAIQALLDKGANSVIFYSVGKTVSKKTVSLQSNIPSLTEFSIINQNAVTFRNEFANSLPF